MKNMFTATVKMYNYVINYILTIHNYLKLISKQITNIPI